jgi:hypothetical protein
VRATAERVAHSAPDAFISPIFNDRVIRQLIDDERMRFSVGPIETIQSDAHATTGNARTELRIGVTGHRALAPSADLLARIAEAVAALQASGDDGSANRDLVLVSALAEGADRFVAAIVLAEPNARLHAILPMPPEAYSADFHSQASRSAVDDLLRRAAETTIMPPSLTRSDAYAAAGQAMVDQSDALIALWDGKPARGRGGTAEVVQLAKQRGLPIIWISSEPPFALRRLGQDDH